MTPTEAITALEKALEAGPTQESEWLSAGSCVFELTMRGRHEVNRWAAFVQTSSQAHELSVSDCGRLADYIAACSPLAIRTLLDAHAGALRASAELLDQMHHFANADQRLWDEGQRDPESFIRWVRSRAAHLLAKFTDRAALVTNTKDQP